MSLWRRRNDPRVMFQSERPYSLSFWTMPSDDSFSRDEVAIIVANVHPQDMKTGLFHYEFIPDWIQNKLEESVTCVCSYIYIIFCFVTEEDVPLNSSTCFHSTFLGSQFLVFLLKHNI